MTSQQHKAIIGHWRKRFQRGLSWEQAMKGAQRSFTKLLKK